MRETPNKQTAFSRKMLGRKRSKTDPFPTKTKRNRIRALSVRRICPLILNNQISESLPIYHQSIRGTYAVSRPASAS